ncbi:MAG: tRNA threonylcarbamoyladenosine dehydratase [Clostridia bacterium]
MVNEFSRTALLLGDDAIKKLNKSRVAVFGIGGVGGHVCEALARSGVGNLDLFDNDTVSLSNINRQIVALHSTIGKSKTQIMAKRVKDINPNANVVTYDMFFTPENSHEIDFSVYDYVVDAIDTVSGKIEIIRKAKEVDVKVISSMGAGNKLDPTAFEIADISKTSVCPLARVVRKKLKELNIKDVKVLFSKEEAMTPFLSTESKGSAGRPVPGSTAFVPSVAGLIIGGEVVKDLAK